MRQHPPGAPYLSIACLRPPRPFLAPSTPEGASALIRAVRWSAAARLMDSLVHDVRNPLNALCDQRRRSSRRSSRRAAAGEGRRRATCWTKPDTRIGRRLGTITVNGSGVGWAPAVAVWEAELGVQIAVETMDFRDYLKALVVDPPQVFTINWIADYPSPYALYSLLLLPDATSNYGHWDDPEFVQLLEAASGAESEADQA